MKPKYLARLILIFILGFFAMALLNSCKAQKRHDRLVKKYGKLCVIDTITIKDTIIKEIKVPVPEYRDSFIFKHDTTYETKRVVVYKRGETIFLRVKPDTISIRDTIPFEVKVPGQVIAKEFINWWYLFGCFILGCLFAYFLRR